jgi:hypothetical protein
MRRQRTKATPRPLWTCPRCRRRFKNRNQVHSCGQFTLAELLDGKPPDVVKLFDRLSQLVLRCGEVVVAPTKTRVLYKVRTVFATVAVTKHWLDLVFVLGRRLKHRRIRKAQREYPGIVHFLRIERADDLDDELGVWLQEAYDHRKQKDQGSGKE